MHRLITLFTSTLIIITVAFNAQASDDKRPEHFKAEAAPTLEQALLNLTEYNAKLAVILTKQQLEPLDMATIHQLTYTLEAALAKLDNEIDGLKDTLEEVHLGSEMMEFERVRRNGLLYLSTSQKIIKP